MQIELVELAGIKPALRALRMPFKGTSLGFEKDVELMSKLVLGNHDSHAKCTRGIIAYLEVNASRKFWVEMDTYRVGREQLSSESTIHTLLKDEITESCFSNIDPRILSAFKAVVADVRTKYETKQITKADATVMLKDALPESFMQKRSFCVSYQTLRRIYFERRNHTLPEWRQFCKFIESLDMANDLIIEKA